MNDRTPTGSAPEVPDRRRIGSGQTAMGAGWLAGACLLAAPVCAGTLAHSAEAEPSGTRVVILGTGTPNADPERSGPAVAVVVGGAAYLVDAGPGIVRRAAAAEERGTEALAVEKLGKVFVTHLHSDHTVGLPDLMLTPWVLDRSMPLQVYGPPGIADMTRHLLAAYREDIRMRLYGLEPANPDGYRVDAHEIGPGLVYRDARVSVEAIPVRHGTWPHAFAFKFVASDKTVVISGDTAPSEALARAAAGCDILVHEVYSQAGFENKPEEWKRYHATYHTSTLELADLANRAKPGLLVLYHQLFWGASDEDLLAEVARTYSGRVVSAGDLAVFE